MREEERVREGEGGRKVPGPTMRIGAPGMFGRRNWLLWIVNRTREQSVCLFRGTLLEKQKRNERKGKKRPFVRFAKNVAHTPRVGLGEQREEHEEEPVELVFEDEELGTEYATLTRERKESEIEIKEGKRKRTKPVKSIDIGEVKGEEEME